MLDPIGQTENPGIWAALVACLSRGAELSIQVLDKGTAEKDPSFLERAGGKRLGPAREPPATGHKAVPRRFAGPGDREQSGTGGFSSWPGVEATVAGAGLG